MELWGVISPPNNLYVYKSINVFWYATDTIKLPMEFDKIIRKIKRKKKCVRIVRKIYKRREMKGDFSHWILKCIIKF